MKISATIVNQDLRYALRRVPTQGAPDSLVYIIVNAIRIRDEAVAVAGTLLEYLRILNRPGIDCLASLREREGLVPVPHLILGELVVGQIRIEPQAILFRKPASHFR